ncbi:unnamed protein product [Prorocentrum cordatum]|uniref:Uncharacterized protein n=1 Tax=Prorocentrum cordatum TaxID=2364126 RepID=A0ABN9Q527_9DINO|nr:unnamed protein product [Polarella glacialis]
MQAGAAALPAFHVHVAQVVEAIRLGDRPQGMDAEEAAVWALCDELLAPGMEVGDESYAAAVKVLGEQRVFEVASTVGYYTTLSAAPPGRGAADPAAGAAGAKRRQVGLRGPLPGHGPSLHPLL